MLCAARDAADASIKQADVHGSTARKMEGRARVLEAEIKLDSATGVVSEGKEEALAKAQAKTSEATSSQMGALAQATEAVSKAAEAAQQTGEHTGKMTESETALSDFVSGYAFNLLWLRDFPFTL